MGFEFGCKCGRSSHEKGYCDGTHKQPKIDKIYNNQNKENDGKE